MARCGISSTTPPRSRLSSTATLLVGRWGLVCHAPGVLHTVKKQDGTSLIVDRSVTGFTNGEEEAAGLTSVVPFLVEDSLTEAGARYSKGADGESYVVTDGTLVTGQNPASSADAAQRLLDLLTH